MQTFVMLTRLGAEAARSPKALEQLEREAMERVRKECPDVEWVGNCHRGPRCDQLGYRCVWILASDLRFDEVTMEV